MAKSTIIYNQIEEVTKKKTAATGVALNLSVKEAIVLATLLSNVGGAPSTTLRGEAQDVLDSLEEQGIYGFYHQPEHETLQNMYEGSFYFKATTTPSFDYGAILNVVVERTTRELSEQV
jgi:hypothetical protein